MSNIYSIGACMFHDIAVVIDRNFLKYYGSSQILESFLYPYINKNTLSLIGNDLLWHFFYYLHDCCKEVDDILHDEKFIVPWHRACYVWSDVSDINLKHSLLISLKDMFDLQNVNIDNTDFEKINDGNSLLISNPEFSIIIELDLKRKKAIATLDKGKRKFEYDIFETPSDIVLRTTESEEKVMEREFYSRGLIQTLICKLISKLGFSNKSNIKVLSNDNKFRKIAYDIKKVFNDGYKMLNDL
jgi:hypothetical protein